MRRCLVLIAAVRAADDAPSSIVCLFPAAAFQNMIPGELSDGNRVQEIIQSVAVDSKASVDDLAAKSQSAGAKLRGQLQDAPYGYGCGFTDPNGHVWSVLWLAGPGS